MAWHIKQNTTATKRNTTAIQQNTTAIQQNTTALGAKADLASPHFTCSSASPALFGLTEAKIKTPNYPPVQFYPQIGIYSKYGNAQTSVVFQNSQGRAGYIDTNKATVLYASTSDYRLKTGCRPLKNATEKVQLLKPCSFEFVSDPGQQHCGFLAHEVAAVCPQAVAGEKDAVTDDGEILPQGLDQSQLVPLLVKSIQELAARVDQLEKERKQ